MKLVLIFFVAFVSFMGAAEKEGYNPHIRYVIEQLKYIHIDDYPRIGGRSTGDGGTPHQTYYLFQYLHEFAYRDDLELMLQDDHPLVRVIGIWCSLYQPKQPIKSGLIDEFRDDESIIRVGLGGCSFEGMTVGEFTRRMQENHRFMEGDRYPRNSKAGVDTMSFEEFDKEGANWRFLAKNRKYFEATDLIDSFLYGNPEGKRYKLILNWHAGQMLASADQYKSAIGRFQDSYQVEGEEDRSASLGKQWNAYVDATIAFLKKDQDSLLEYRALIESGPDGKMKTLNGSMVDRFIANIDKTYNYVYSSSLVDE